MQKELPVINISEIKTLSDSLLVIAAQQRVIERLEQRISELEERLNTNSKNSSQSPSKDTTKSKNKLKSLRRKSGKKRGAQKGRKGKSRKLVSSDKVSHFVQCSIPSTCECGCQIRNEGYKRHQVEDIPEHIEVEVTEYQLHQGRCRGCGKRYSGNLPQGTPLGRFGPRVIGLMSLLSTRYRLSRSLVKGLVKEIFNLDISIGTVSQKEFIVSSAVKSAYEELKKKVRESPVRYADETGYSQEEKPGQAWVMCSDKGTVFMLHPSRGKKAAKMLLGENTSLFTTTDRYSSYEWLDPQKRQVCWAHLKRDFTRISQREGPPGKIGTSLLQSTRILFELWNSCHSLEQLQQKITHIQNHVLVDLHLGAKCTHQKTQGTCNKILQLKAALWNFTKVKGVEPTNNISERALRQLVIHRKLSFGTKSYRGSKFIERAFSLVETHRNNRENLSSLFQNSIQDIFYHANDGSGNFKSLLPKNHLVAYG